MNKALKDFKDEDLRKELADREADRKAKAVEKNQQWLHKLVHVVSQDVVDMLAPEHKPRSDGSDCCSDESPYLGFGSHRACDPPECIRCGLIEVMKGTASENVLNNLVEFEFSIRVTPP